MCKGEPTPDSWPNINSHFGILDITGFPKDRFYWYQQNYRPLAGTNGLKMRNGFRNTKFRGTEERE